MPLTVSRHKRSQVHEQGVDKCFDFERLDKRDAPIKFDLFFEIQAVL